MEASLTSVNISIITSAQDFSQIISEFLLILFTFVYGYISPDLFPFLGRKVFWVYLRRQYIWNAKNQRLVNSERDSFTLVSTAVCSCVFYRELVMLISRLRPCSVLWLNSALESRDGDRYDRYRSETDDVSFTIMFILSS